MPEAAMPPPAISYRPSSNRRSPPPSILPMHGGGPNRPTPPPSTLPVLVGPSRPTPPQGPGAAAAFTTRETAPSSSRTPSRTSSSRSRDVNRAVQGLPHLTVPVTSSPAPSHTSRRTTPGLSRISFAPNTRFRDSAYGSSNISPIDVPKAESVSSETHSTTTSGHSANDRYNYTNNHVAVRRGKEVYRDEDEVSNSSEGRKNYRIVRRVPGEQNDEENDRRIQEDMRAAIEYQSQTSEHGEGSVRSGSGSGRRHRHHRHHRRHGSDE